MFPSFPAVVRRMPGRTLLFVGAAIIFTLPAPAQEPEDETAPVEAAEAEERAEDLIVVTGSRIPRDPNVASPVPLESIDAEELRLSGNPDVTATLIQIPSLLTSTTFGNSIGGLFGSGSGETASAEDGEALLNLRGLGIERTLVLVDGRRHVSGVGGAAAVDINTIPKGLIERVEVLTGGASAIYGADAVSGVVNFIMKKDFEGIQIDAQAGISGHGDGEQFAISGVAGRNFDNDRGNFTIAVDYADRSEILEGDRDFTRNGAISADFPNPALLFQAGDIDPVSTPHFANFFNVANGFYPTGFAIPVLSDADFISEFGEAPTDAERALMERAASSPPRAILPFPNFSITSNSGVVVPASFDPAHAGVALIDVNGNGIPDCDESFVGFNSLFQGAAFGAAGGCWNLAPDGTPLIYRDGLIAGDFNHFGGDGATQRTNRDSLIPDDSRIAVNFFATYDLTPGITAYGEFKYVWQKTEVFALQNSFWDLLTIEADNPFIPDALRPVAEAVAAAGGGAFNPEAVLHITKDPIDLGAGQKPGENVRETFRFVGGLKGTFDNDWNWEFHGNYGQFNLTSTDPSRLIPDRFFAAIDVTTDEDGNPICESDLETSPPPSSTPFNIPGADPAILTFTPGDGSCKPANIFGIGNVSQEAIDFIVQKIVNEFELSQFVFSGVVAGDTHKYFSLPAGPIGFAAGAEYRNEESSSIFDPLVRGIIPVDTVFVPDDPENGFSPTSTPVSGVEGTPVSDLGLTQNSLAFDPESRINNAGGSFDVYEFFAEISVPVIKDMVLVRDLTVDAAARFSDYSTIGSTWTWKAGGTWTPVDDIRVRGGYSVAIRAPNIQELFSPEQGTFFRPNDPCAQAAIDALIAAGDPRGPVREANCRADGIPEGFVDPLSARFVGVTGGNPDLQEETAKTFTVGTVITPRWIDNLTLFADYWNITIDNAIAVVGDDDIVANCYDSESFPNQFCDLFSRNRNPNSPQFLGFNFMRQVPLNFAALQTDGIDFGADYAFEVGAHRFDISVSGTRVRNLNNFFDPLDPEAVDPELGELQRPEWAGRASAKWSYGAVSLQWRTQYMSEQTLRDVEIETRIEEYGENGGLVGDTFIHDVSLAYIVNDSFSVYGGVSNVTDVLPFITERAFPVSPLGRFFFLGVTWSPK